MDELKRLEAILKLGVKYRAKHLTVHKDEVSISYEDHPPFVPAKQVLDKIRRSKDEAVVPTSQEIAGEGMPGDDEMLFYSTQAFDEIRTERADD